MAQDGRVRGAIQTAGANPSSRIAPKVHIDDVCVMFHANRTEISRAVHSHKAMSPEQHHAFDEAKANLKAKLHAVGLAQHIDWRDKS